MSSWGSPLRTSRRWASCVTSGSRGMSIIMRYDVRVPKNWEKETDKIYAKGMLRLSSRHEEVLSFPEALPSWKSSARKTSPPVIWGVFWFPSPQSLLSSISSFSSSSSKFFGLRRIPWVAYSDGGRATRKEKRSLLWRRKVFF